MKSTICRFFLLLTVVILIFSFPCNGLAATTKSATVNYEKQLMTVKVSKMKNSYVVPLNDIFQAWGGSTKLDTKKKTMTATMDKLILSVTNGSNTASIGKVKYTMESMAILQRSTMYVPIDLFSKALGIKAEINKAYTSVVLYFKSDEKKTEADETEKASVPVIDIIPQVKPKFTYNMYLVGFYNAGTDVPDPRLNSSIIYAYKFNQSTARVICYNTKVTFSNLATTVTAPITVRYYRKDGTLFYERKSSITLKKGASSFYYRWGIGWDKAGNWKEDTYTLEIYFWDKQMLRESFQIFSLLPDQMNGSIWTQKDENGISGQYAFLLKGGYIYFGFKGDAASIYNDDTGMRGGSGKGGMKYKLALDKLTVYTTDGKVAAQYKRQGNTILVGDGKIKKEVTKGVNGAPDLESISMDGAYTCSSK